METSAEIFSKIDFKRLFRDFNRGSRRKLTPRDKKILKLLVHRYLPVTSGDTAALSKALEAGNYGAPSKLLKGSALRPESLEATLKCVTFDDTTLKLWKSKKKRKKNGKQVVQTTNRLRRRRKLRVR